MSETGVVKPKPLDLVARVYVGAAVLMFALAFTSIIALIWEPRLNGLGLCFLILGMLAGHAAIARVRKS